MGGCWERCDISRFLDSERVSKKKEVEVSRQGRNCHSERREASLWRRSCLEPKIHACDYSIAAQLILRFAQNDNSIFILHGLYYTFLTPSERFVSTKSKSDEYSC